MTKRILILGGYGNTGPILAELLLKETTVELVLAGRHLRKAREMAGQLNERHNCRRWPGFFTGAWPGSRVGLTVQC